jgi:hypothetical protein
MCIYICSIRLNEVDNEDADLSDAMIRGNDGRFYFTDHYDLGMITPTSEIGIYTYMTKIYVFIFNHRFFINFEIVKYFYQQIM